MMILTLPLEKKCPDDWEAFLIALDHLDLTLIEISDESVNCVKAQINAESEEQEQAVLDLIQLCFSKYYVV